MKVGLTLPQGCDREFLAMDPRAAWERTVAVAQQAEAAGFESLWVYDHMQVDPPPEPAIVFEPLVELAAIATATSRARLGHLVLAAAYRNAGLTAKAISTIAAGPSSERTPTRTAASSTRSESSASNSLKASRSVASSPP